jgi:hydroxymethylpyrimidine pyrophosphatase-like HAD family hydrolase
VKGPYVDELSALAGVYDSARHVAVPGLHEALNYLGSGPCVFIGSGGTMAIAHLAAHLHEVRHWQPAQVCTALEALSLTYQPERGAILFSSSAKHPDADMVLETFRRRLFGRTAVLTHRNPHALEEKAGPDTSIVQLPHLPVRDGFLATGSVMQMAVGLLVASGGAQDLPEKLEVDLDLADDLREEVLVLHSPALRSVASDIEVRLVESGLAAVQVSDFRNFAHGRHTGFARRIDRVSVIALSDGSSEALASGTLCCLPPNAHVLHWNVSLPSPASVPALLERSMVTAGAAGERVGLDVARPSVPGFGRSLYNLPLKRRLAYSTSDGVDRKLRASAFSEDSAIRHRYGVALAGWSREFAQQRFGGVVLDYDGTVCWTSKRFGLPGEELRSQLTALLEGGAKVGFASGRGRSLYNDLRDWVPRQQWSAVYLGLYNGAVLLSLAEELGDLRSPTAWSSSVVSALHAIPGLEPGCVTERGEQVTIDLIEGAPIRLDEVVRWLQVRGVKASVATSGHSIDIVRSGTSKVSVIAHLEAATSRPVLAVGDQGHRSGNDFELLAARPWSLTVDRCSADPDRCWFLGDGREVGPDLLARYLGSLRQLNGGLAVRGLTLP